MICKLRRLDPSLTSMNEKSFESRRVRTQPWTRIAPMGAVLCSASLIGVGEGCVMLGLGNVQRSTLNVKLQRSNRGRPRATTIRELLPFWRDDLVGQFFESRITAERIKQRFHFNQANFCSLFVFVVSFEPTDRFVLINEPSVNQSKAERPKGAMLLKIFQLCKQLQRS